MGHWSKIVFCLTYVPISKRNLDGFKVVVPADSVQNLEKYVWSSVQVVSILDISEIYVDYSKREFSGG